MPLIEFADVPVIRRAVLRLRSIERLQREHASELDALGADTGALLASCEAIVQGLRSVDGTMRSLVGRIEESSARDTAALARHRDELERVTNALSAHDADLQASLDHLQRVIGSGFAELLRKSIDHLEGLVDFDADATNADEEGPERALCAYLAPYLRDPHVMDIGAHRGAYTRALLDQGLEVVAVEPDEALAARLREEFGGYERALIRQVAVADHSGRAQLYHAVDTTEDQVYGDTTLFSSLIKRDRVDGMAFEPGPEVETLTIDELRSELSWPTGVGMVKVDVEGLGLSVLAGFGNTRPETLSVEYWGSEYMLARDAPGTGSAELVDVSLKLGYRRWITIIHRPDLVTFAVNTRTVPPESWGNIIFIEDREVFVRAVRWCEAVLTRELRN